MTRRAAPRPSRRPLPCAAGFLAAALLVTGCGSDGTATSPSADTNGRSGGAPAAERQDTVDQSTPGLAAQSYFNAVSDARFGDACAVLAPVVRGRYASAGQDCRTAVAELFDEATRAAIGEVAADESAVEVTGDTALVPGSALRRTDLPQGAERPSFPDIRASRQDGRWYLVL